MRPLALLIGLLLAAMAPPSRAGTAISLSDRILIDGSAEEYLPDETMFQVSPDGRKEESSADSRWGVFDDLNQIRITWDARFLYVAVEGFTGGAFGRGNNVMIFFDTVPVATGNSPGLSGLTNLNSWRRNIVFDGGFFPDLFMATWDGNQTPQLWTVSGDNQVLQVPQTGFRTVATFSGQQAGRAMEAAIPWDIVFLGKGTSEFQSGYGDTVYVMPESVRQLRVAAWITAADDGLGGPDTAPDNLGGHQVDAGIQVVMDNFMIIQLDTLNVFGESERDQVVDFGVEVRKPTVPGMSNEAYDAIRRAFFFIPPPIIGQAVEIVGLQTGPRLIAPELGETATFRFNVSPELLDPGIRQLRTFPFTAELYDLQGRRVRILYENEEFTVDELAAEDPPPSNVIDGRDDNGNLLEAGTYVLVVIYEPLQSQERATVTIVR